MNQLPQKLERFFSFLETEVQPKRALLNQDSDALFAMFEKMTKLGMLGVRIPNLYNGLALTADELHLFNRNLARSSAALTLLQTQHQSVQGLIAHYATDEFKHTWLPPSCTGEVRLGIGFSHLHQIEYPPVTAREYSGHFVVNGPIRYATGYSVFNWLVLGFIIDNEEFMALIPFEEQDGLEIGDKMSLIAADSTQTICFNLTDYKVLKQNIFSRNPVGTFHAASIRSKHIVAYHMGTTLAILDLIAISPLMKVNHVSDAYSYLQNKVSIQEKNIANYPEGAITAPLRVQTLRLLQKTMFFADQIFRGAATNINHPLLLLKHEAQIFAALASEEEMLKATCNSLLE